MGGVKERGDDLPSGKNHADYMSKTGWYNITQYLIDHKEIFPGIYRVGVGQCAPHSTTEVNCESLFSQSGNQSDANTKTQTFERLVIAKHRVGRICCCPKKVMKPYMKREGKKDWDKTDERDDKSFLELEKVKYLELYPHNKGFFEVEGMDVEEEEENDEEGGESC